MYIPLLLTLLACGSSADPGDLWLQVDAKTSNETIELNLPANWMADTEEPIWVDTKAGRVDLRAEANTLQGKRNGNSETWTIDDGDDTTVFVLSKEARTGEPATKVGVQTVGPKGNGLTLTLEISPANVGRANAQLDAALDLNGLPIHVDKAMAEQLSATPPRVLLKTTGPKGGGVVVETTRATP